MVATVCVWLCIIVGASIAVDMISNIIYICTKAKGYELSESERQLKRFFMQNIAK